MDKRTVGAAAGERLLAVFGDFLEAQGLRRTGPRWQVARIVGEMPTHFTAEELYRAARRKGLKVGRGTVYRTLAILAQAKVVEARQFRKEITHYEAVVGRDHHEHMVCVACGRIIEFQSEEIERLQDVVLERRGYTMVSHFLRIYGVCEMCRKLPVP